jgi:hypothetical protein
MTMDRRRVVASVLVALESCGPQPVGDGGGTSAATTTTTAVDDGPLDATGAPGSSSTSPITTAVSVTTEASTSSTSGSTDDGTTGIDDWCSVEFPAGINCGTIEQTDECAGFGSSTGGDASTSTGVDPCAAIAADNAAVEDCIAQAKADGVAYSYVHVHHLFENIGQYDIHTRRRVRPDGMTRQHREGWEDLCYLDRVDIYANYGATQLQTCSDNTRCK